MPQGAARGVTKQTAAAESSGRSSELVSKVIGWLVVVVPVTVFFVIAVAITEPQFDKQMSTPLAWLASVGSVLMSIGVVYVWTRFKRRKR